MTPTIKRILLIATGVGLALAAKHFDLTGFYELGVGLAGSQALKRVGDVTDE